MVAALFHVPASLGYGLLFVLVGMESSGIPVPGETGLVAAGVLAGQGRLSIPFVIAVAAAGAIVGDNVGYFLGRRGLRRLLARPGRFQRRRTQLLEDGERFFRRYGARAVFFGRFVAAARVVVAWLAGAEQMPWRRFFVWNALGGIAWATAIGLLAYWLGSRASSVIAALGYGALAVAVVAAIAYLVTRTVMRRRHASG